MRSRHCCAAIRLITAAPGFAATWWNNGAAALDSRMEAVRAQMAGLPELPPPQRTERTGFHSIFAGTTQAARWVEIDLGASRDFDSVVIVPAFFASAEQGSGAYGMPPRFRLDASDDPTFASYQTLADHTEADFTAGLSPVSILAKSKARFVRFTATRLVKQRLGNGFFCLGEMLVFAGPRDIAVGCPVSSSGAYETRPTWSVANLADGITHLGAPIIATKIRSNGWHSGIERSAEKTKWVQVDLGSVQPLDEVRLYPAHPPDFPERPGFGFPVRFRAEAGDDAAFTSPRVLLDSTAGDFPNPADNAVVIPAHGASARYIRVTALKLWERSNDFIFALAELEAFSGGKNIARGAAGTSLDETRVGAWSAERLTDGETSLAASPTGRAGCATSRCAAISTPNWHRWSSSVQCCAQDGRKVGSSPEGSPRSRLSPLLPGCICGSGHSSAARSSRCGGRSLVIFTMRSAAASVASR